MPSTIEFAYRLVVSPNSPVVSVGVTTSFELAPANFATDALDPFETVAWAAYRLDVTWQVDEGPDGRTATFASDTEVLQSTEQSSRSWSVTWSKPGLWDVMARVERTGELFHAMQEVLPRAEFVMRSKAWPKEAEDPHAAADWGRHVLESMIELGALRTPDDTSAEASRNDEESRGDFVPKPMTVKEQRRHEGEVQKMRQFVAGLEGLLLGVPDDQLSFIRGVWAPAVVDKDHRPIPLRAFLYKVKHPAPGPIWVLVDWTNPTCNRSLAVHTGGAMTDAASIELALQRWSERCQYPAGFIEIEVDGWAGYALVRAKNDGNARRRSLSTPNHALALTIADILGWVSLGAFVLGIIAASTGIGAAFTPALFAVSSLSGAASGAFQTIYLINTGSENWRAYVLDALTIAGNLLGLRGSAFKLFGTAPIRIGSALTTERVVFGELATTTAELYFIAEGTFNEFQKILHAAELTPKEQFDAATRLLGAAAGTALLAWSARQNVEDIVNMRRFLDSAIKPEPIWRGHVEAGKTESEHMDIRVHSAQAFPDQALFYWNFLGIRAAANHAADAPHTRSLDAPTGIVGRWMKGKHWLSEWPKKKPGVVSVLELPDGRFVPGRSASNQHVLDQIAKNGDVDSPTFYAHIRNPELQEALAAIEVDEKLRGRGHGACAEVLMLDDAINLVGVDGLRGAVSDARLVRTNRSDSRHGIAIPACESCQQLFKRFGVIDINSLRRGNRRVPTRVIVDYLKRLGFPGNWARTDEAMALLKQRGFPVSAAAREMVRRFGGLETTVSGPPDTPPVRGQMSHAPARFYIDPFDVLDDLETAKAMEEESGARDLCAVGNSTDGVGLMCIDPQGTVWFQDSGFTYSGTADEVIERLLTGRPDRLSDRASKSK